MSRAGPTLVAGACRLSGGSASGSVRSLPGRATPSRLLSDHAPTVVAMTDPVDSTPGSITNSQRPKRSPASIAALTLIVRPVGNPTAVQTFTDSEAAEAQRYADAMGAVVERLAGAG